MTVFVSCCFYLGDWGESCPQGHREGANYSVNLKRMRERHRPYFVRYSNKTTQMWKRRRYESTEDRMLVDQNSEKLFNQKFWDISQGSPHR